MMSLALDDKLSEVAETGEIDKVLFLIERGADVFTNDLKPLRNAIQNGHKEVAELLARACRVGDIQLLDLCDMTVAIKKNHRGIVELWRDTVLKQPPRIQQIIVSQNTIQIWLEQAACYCDPKMLEIFLEFIYDLDHNDGAALVSAIGAKNIPNVRFLLEKGASADINDNEPVFKARQVDSDAIEAMLFRYSAGEPTRIDYDILRYLKTIETCVKDLTETDRLFRGN